MKKIAILTFSHAFNYGAVLQAYALKTAIQTLGFQVACVDYRSPFYPDTKWRRKFLFLSKRAIKFLRGCPFSPMFFYKFMKKYLQDTPPIMNEQLSQLNNQFDLFITGSDQVWNFAITHGDTAFLLDFVTDSKKKSSYAASFGFDYIDEAAKPVFARLLPQFTHLSVREQSGAALVKQITGKDVPVVLDPTLLLSQAHWASFAAPIQQKGYVLLYLMNENDKIISFAKNLAQKKGLPLRCISFGKIKGISGFGCTPEEFVGYFQNASYVVTNSFHGLAFSINLNKTFFVDWLPPSWPANPRLEQLLKTTGLENRLLDNLTNIDDSIDWNAVNKRLQTAREESIQFLQSVLTDEKPN